MKNFKKVVALVLALSLVLSTGITAFAATENATEGHVLYQLGLMKGTSTTEEMLALDDEANAYMAITLIGRALGWESEATEVAFTDVPAYAVPYVAYAVEMKITNGIDPTTFGSYVDGARMVTWILRALGYDMTEAYTMTDELAATAGIVVPTTDPITRDAVAGVIYDTLSATPVDGDMTVIETLVKADETLRAAAVAAGLMAAVPDTLEVVSVVANNLKQFVVTFNTPLNAAGDEGNYELDDDADADITATADFELSEDKKVVTITLGDGEKSTQQETVDLTVKDLVLADMSEQTDDILVEDILVIDMTIPTVVMAEAIGVDTIKVTFSEPMTDLTLETNANYTVTDADGDKIYVADAVAGDTGLTVNIELLADLEDDVTIEVKNIEDYQGFTALKTALSVPVTVDETKPAIVSYKDVSRTKVTLVFDGDIEESSGFDASDFYHTNENNPADTATIVNGNEIDLVFTTDELPVGTAYLYVKKETVNDLWDNKNDKLTVTLDVTVDEIAPVVEGSVDVKAQDEIEISFSEEISVDGDDYEITLYEDGKVSDIDVSTSKVVGDDKDILELVFDEDLYGDFEVKIEGVEDTNENVAKTVTLAFNVADETAPTGAKFTATLYNEGLTKQILYIDFDEEMDAASVTNKKMYFADGQSLDDNGVTITVADGGKAVEIEINTSDADLLALATGDSVVIGRVADAAGNLLTSLSVTKVIEQAGTIAIKKVQLTAVDTIVLTVDGKLTENVDPKAVTFNDGVTYGKVKTGLDSDNRSTFTYTLAKDINPDATSSVAITYTVTSALGDNEYGESVAPVTNGTIADKVGPSIAETKDLNDDTVDNVKATATDKITITFDEAINPLSVSVVTFEVDGGDIGVEAVTFDAGYTQIILDLVEADLETSPEIADLLGVKVVQKATIKDASGNTLKDATTEVGKF